jgi:hypothetical protein
MTLEDLKQYTTKVKNALSIDYRGYKLFTTDAPSSGAVMLSILNTMNQYPPEDSQDLNLTSHRCRYKSERISSRFVPFMLSQERRLSFGFRDNIKYPKKEIMS